MITVSIAINGEPIFTRTAVNTAQVLENGCTVYELDCESKVHHRCEDGVVKLAKKMLGKIKERGTT